jgi:hypothetical protein
MDRPMAAQKLRQLGDIAGNAPCLILAEQLGWRNTADLLPLRFT